MERGQWRHWSTSFRGERPSVGREQLEIWGYTDRPSYAPGEEIALHVSTTVSAFDLKVLRDGAEREVVYERSGIPGAWHPTPDGASAEGCAWPVATVIPTSPSWASGGFIVELTARDDRGEASQDAFFVLRPASCQGGLAMVAATYTWQAYNDWGGASFYNKDDGSLEPSSLDLSSSQRTADGFSPRLSFQRPWARGLVRLPVGAPRITLATPPEIGWAPRYEQSEWAYANGYSIWSGMAGWARHDALFFRWAEQNGYRISLFSQWDLDRDPTVLDGYSAVVTTGHDEYWTASGREVLDGFIEAGGRYLRLAGNIFWQSRIEDLETLVCFKYVPELDPLAASTDPGVPTGAFEGRSIANPPVTTFGANGARGVYSRMGGMSPRGVGGLVVYRNDHWVFADADVYYADVIGSEVPLVGYEADGVTYTFRDGLPFPTGEDGAPDDLLILALTPVTLEEEDHRIDGGFLLVGDGDLGFAAKALHGVDTAATRERVKRGAAVMTWMRKGRGEVIAGGTTEWPYALAQGSEVVERIVRTILDRFVP